MPKTLIERLQNGGKVDDLVKDGKLQLGDDEETPSDPKPGAKK